MLTYRNMQIVLEQRHRQLRMLVDYREPDRSVISRRVDQLCVDLTTSAIDRRGSRFTRKDRARGEGIHVQERTGRK